MYFLDTQSEQVHTDQFSLLQDGKNGDAAELRTRVPTAHRQRVTKYIHIVLRPAQYPRRGLLSDSRKVLILLAVCAETLKISAVRPKYVLEGRANQVSFSRVTSRSTKIGFTPILNIFVRIPGEFSGGRPSRQRNRTFPASAKGDQVIPKATVIKYG